MSVKSKFYDIIFTCRFLCTRGGSGGGGTVKKFPIPSLLKDSTKSETFVAGKFSGRTHKSFLKMFVCVYESIGGDAVRLSSRETQTQTSICSPSTDKRRRRVAIYFYIHHFCCCAWTNRLVFVFNKFHANKNIWCQNVKLSNSSLSCMSGGDFIACSV